MANEAPLAPQFRANGWKSSLDCSFAFSFAPASALVPQWGLAHSLVHLAQTKTPSLQSAMAGMRK